MGNIAELISIFVLVGALVASSARDLADRVIPNACVALVAAARVPAIAFSGDPAAAAARALAGAACVLAFLLAAVLLGRKALGSAGIGAGDIKLWSALGLWTGPVGGLAVVGASCAIALAARGAHAAALRAWPRPSLFRGRGHQAPSFSVRRGKEPEGAARREPAAAEPSCLDAMPMAPSIAAAMALVSLCGLC